VRRPALAAALAVLLALPAAALGQGVSAPHRATAILHSVLVAPALIDYEGTKIISTRRGDRVETVTVLEAHKRPNQTRLEFLSPDSLVGRLVVDNGVEAWHYEPSLHTAFQGPTLTRPGRAADQLRGLLAAYGVALMGTEEVIGRPTFVLALDAKTGGSRRLMWIDQATGVPLRVEERRGGETIYATYFTRISFSLNLPEALFRFRAPAGARIFSLFASEEEGMTLEQVQRAVGFRVRTPAALPPGIRFDRANVVRYGPVAAADLRYTDGAAPISVFQVPARRVAGQEWAPAGEIVTSIGVSVRVIELGYFRVLTWEESGLRLTVVGAQPRRVLLALAAQFFRR